MSSCSAVRVKEPGPSGLPRDPPASQGAALRPSSCHCSRSQASRGVKDRGGSAAGTGPYVTAAFPAGRSPSAPGSAAFQGFLLFDLPVARVSVTWMGRAEGSGGPWSPSSRTSIRIGRLVPRGHGRRKGQGAEGCTRITSGLAHVFTNTRPLSICPGQTTLVSVKGIPGA